MIYLSEPAVFAGCEEKSIDLTYYFDTENSANPAASNLFPREYRSLMHLNNIYANIPSGFNFTKADGIITEQVATEFTTVPDELLRMLANLPAAKRARPPGT